MSFQQRDQQSQSLVITQHMCTPQPYGYNIQSGNNSQAIQIALKKRNVWVHFQNQKQLHSTSFFWRPLNYNAKLYADFDEILKYYPSRFVLLNHFEHNQVLTTKSGLLKTLRYYYSHEYAMIERSCHIFDTIPTSFIIHAQKDDIEYRDFRQRYNQINKGCFYKEKMPEKHCEHNVWFVKPESNNQGKGIILSNSLKEIDAFLLSKPINSGWYLPPRRRIVQKAIQKPLLYYGRKFDIRVWILVTPQLDVYYYNTPYMRTTSSAYTLEQMSSQVHLTNNCQQKHFSEYSKYQQGNTIPLLESLSKYLETVVQGDNVKAKVQQILAAIIARIKEIVIETLHSARVMHLLRQKHFTKVRRKEFQLFGYDFLVDEDYRAWLLEVNNNPYLGVPNQFIKELLPLMLDEMLEIIVDPLFPPLNYTPVSEKRFQLIYKQTSTFRIVPLRGMSSSIDSKILPAANTKRDKSFSLQKSLYATEKVIRNESLSMALNNKGTLPNPTPSESQKQLKLKYSTPSQTIKYLLDNYCFNDLQPFMLPVTMILQSNSLREEQFLESNLRKLKLITETRLAAILLEPKLNEICTNIISQDYFHQKIKATLLMGYASACKTFKVRLFVIRKVIPLLSDQLRLYRGTLDLFLLEAMIKLLIASGGYLDRNVFIPGQSRQNQFIREIFIKSNTFKLLLFLRKMFPKICQTQISTFMDNFSDKDWELFFSCGENKSKRAYSPKAKAANATENEDEKIIINVNAINDDRPRVITQRQIAEVKGFRTRRHSGAVATKKQ